MLLLLTVVVLSSQLAAFAWIVQHGFSQRSSTFIKRSGPFVPHATKTHLWLTSGGTNKIDDGSDYNGCGPLFAKASDKNDHIESSEFSNDCHTPNLGVLRGVDSTMDIYYANEIDMSKEGLAWLDQPGLMWEAVLKDVAGRKESANEYIERVKANLEQFSCSDIIHDRHQLLAHLDNAFTSKGAFTFLLGGKSIGKSKVLQKLSKTYNAFNKAKCNLLVLYIDGRSSTGSLDVGLAKEIDRLEAESTPKEPPRKEWFKKIKRFVTFGGGKILARVVKDGNGKDNSINNALGLVSDSVFGPDAKVQEVLLDRFIQMAQSRNAFPVLVVDEADLVLGKNINGTADSQSKLFLTNVFSCTKQDNALNVIMASSEHGYPYRVESEGMNLAEVNDVIFAGEIPPTEMRNLLVNAVYDEGNHAGCTIIDMGAHLADLCLAAYGGNFWRVKNAIRRLAIEQDEFEISSFLPDQSPQIIKCLDADAMAQPLLESMAKYGFAPIKTPENPAVKMIIAENIGGVVTKSASCLGFSKTKWKGTEYTRALIPLSESFRLDIARVLAMQAASKAKCVTTATLQNSILNSLSSTASIQNKTGMIVNGNHTFG